MKASEFKAVEVASRAAENQLSFFNKMMAAKTASNVETQTLLKAVNGKPNVAQATKK